MVVAKQPESLRPYTGTTSYKAYKEYFERICVCKEWKSLTECARHLLVAMAGAASEAVRGLKAEKNSDLALIWEALSRRFGFVDEPERAMHRFDFRKQLEEEILAVIEQSLRMLHREAWPKTNIKSPEADSLLQRKFIDGILDLELQRYLRLHATSDDFATTMSKVRHLWTPTSCRVQRRPASTTSPSSTECWRAWRVIEIEWRMSTLPRRPVFLLPPVTEARRRHQGSPAPSNSSAGSSSSRALSTDRTVRFQDQVDVGSSNQGYGSSGRSRW